MSSVSFTAEMLFLLFSAGCVAVIRIGQLVTRHILRDSDDDNDDDGDDGNDDDDDDDDDDATTEPVFTINHGSH